MYNNFLCVLPGSHLRLSEPHMMKPTYSKYLLLSESDFKNNNQTFSHASSVLAADLYSL